MTETIKLFYIKINVCQLFVNIATVYILDFFRKKDCHLVKQSL